MPSKSREALCGGHKRDGSPSTLSLEEKTMKCVDCEVVQRTRPWMLKCEECDFNLGYDVSGKKLLVICSNSGRCPDE